MQSSTKHVNHNFLLPQCLFNPKVSSCSPKGIPDAQSPRPGWEPPLQSVGPAEAVEWQQLLATQLPASSEGGLGFSSASLPVVCCGVLTRRSPEWPGKCQVPLLSVLSSSAVWALLTVRSCPWAAGFTDRTKRLRNVSQSTMYTKGLRQLLA